MTNRYSKFLTDLNETAPPAEALDFFRGNRSPFDGIVKKLDDALNTIDKQRQVFSKGGYDLFSLHLHRTGVSIKDALSNLDKAKKESMNPKSGPQSAPKSS